MWTLWRTTSVFGHRIWIHLKLFSSVFFCSILSFVGGVLGQLSHEVLMQHCSSSGLRLNDHTSNLFLTIVITWHLFNVIKYPWKARDQRSQSFLLVLPPDTTQNNPASIIRHLQSCPFLWFFILCATEFQGTHLPCSHVNLSAFLKHHSSYLQDNGKKSNHVVWPAPLSKFLKMARGPKSLATPDLCILKNNDVIIHVMNYASNWKSSLVG